MRDTRPFNVNGNTILVPADTVAPAGVQADGQPNANQFRIFNGGTVTAFLGIGVNAAAATAAAVIPVAGTPAAGIPIPAGIVEVISAPPDAYFSAITASGTASVYVTPGEGL